MVMSDLKKHMASYSIKPEMERNFRLKYMDMGEGGFMYDYEDEEGIERWRAIFSLLGRVKNLCYRARI